MSDEAPLLDKAVLEELSESVGGDEEFVRELVDAYLVEGQGHIDEMFAAVGATDTTAIVRPAHTLKSSSAAIGAVRLADICRNIEMAGREGRTDGLAAQVDEAQQAWIATVEALTEAGLVQ